MSEPTASASDHPVDPATAVRAEHEAAAEAAEEMAATDASDAGHGTAGHEGGHGEHGHEDEALGPLDWGAWGAGLVGVAAGLLVAAAFVLSTGVLAV